MSEKKYNISNIEPDSASSRVRWCDLTSEFVQISHELLMARPTLPEELPWGMVRVADSESGVFYRRTKLPTGDFEHLAVPR